MILPKFYIYNYPLDIISQVSDRHLWFKLLKTEIAIFFFHVDLCLLIDSLYYELDSTWMDKFIYLNPFHLHFLNSVSD